MIALVEGAVRQKTPNEIALSILLAGLTIVFLLAVATLEPFAIYAGTTVSTVILIALLVCLIPTTIGGLLSAIGIAGMDRVTRFNVLADVRPRRRSRRRRRRAAARQDRHDHLWEPPRRRDLPVGGATQPEALVCGPPGRASATTRRRAAASWRWPTSWARRPATGLGADAEVIPFSAETRMSGVVRTAIAYFKGAVDAIVAASGGRQHPAGPGRDHRSASRGPAARPWRCWTTAGSSASST